MGYKILQDLYNTVIIEDMTDATSTIQSSSLDLIVLHLIEKFQSNLVLFS